MKTPTFNEWLKKYFNGPCKMIIYERNGIKYSENELFQKYQRAHYPNKPVKPFQRKVIPTNRIDLNQ